MAEQTAIICAMTSNKFMGALHYTIFTREPRKGERGSRYRAEHSYIMVNYYHLRRGGMQNSIITEYDMRRSSSTSRVGKAHMESHGITYQRSSNQGLREQKSDHYENGTVKAVFRHDGEMAYILGNSSLCDGHGMRTPALRDMIILTISKDTFWI